MKNDNCLGKGKIYDDFFDKCKDDLRLWRYYCTKIARYRSAIKKVSTLEDVTLLGMVRNYYTVKHKPLGSYYNNIITALYRKYLAKLKTTNTKSTKNHDNA